MCDIPFYIHVKVLRDFSEQDLNEDSENPKIILDRGTIGLVPIEIWQVSESSDHVHMTLLDYSEAYLVPKSALLQV